jgi:hypothetical protein
MQVSLYAEVTLPPEVGKQILCYFQNGLRISIRGLGELFDEKPRKIIYIS